MSTTTTPGTAGSGEEQVREQVRARYAASARHALSLTDVSTPAGADGTAGCGPSGGCCDGDKDPMSAGLYDADESPSAGALAASLGCGNPTALADLRPGQDVLDLGSGGGLDVLLSARRVGPGGHAFGVDMTPEMLELARRHQAGAGVQNATFLQGTIEDVPLPDGSVDVVLSNCVVNLSPDKPAVVREAHRVLRPGGRLAVSDIVLLSPVPPALEPVVALWTGCISGALHAEEYVRILQEAGFVEAGVQITRRYTREQLVELADQVDPADRPAGMSQDELVDALDGTFASAFVRAVRP
ncbi:arsenite methyltransferase [Ornithinimicrobium sp. W1679]|uniref:arsenite methyltransferase n=1 Tax=Ornithinimicrobium sp. W1679 TaxID=3418770 RepID=UPI003CF27A06